MALRRRVVALVMFLIGRLSAWNGVMCVTARSRFVSVMSVLNNRRAAWLRCAGSRRYAVMVATAKDTVRQDGQAGDDDDKLVHCNVGKRTPQLRLNCQNPFQYPSTTTERSSSYLCEILP